MASRSSGEGDFLGSLCRMSSRSARLALTEGRSFVAARKLALRRRYPAGCVGTAFLAWMKITECQFPVGYLKLYLECKIWAGFALSPCSTSLVGDVAEGQ